MRRICLGIAGIVMAAMLVGCSDTGVQEGPVPFKGTSTEQFNAGLNEMKKTQAESAKKVEGDGKTVETKPAADSKSAAPKPAETKPAADSKPAAETKPAGEPKPPNKS